MSDYLNIPIELRQIPSWCLWRMEDIGAAKPTKIPYSVHGELANVNDVTTWATFEDTLTALHNSHINGIPYSGIGFVFSDRDPFTFIDLDDPQGDAATTDRHLKIFREFDSYAEVSPSGKGLHIIVEGKFEGKGRRRSNIEVYCRQRYATFTGKVYNNKPIQNHQDKLYMLYEQMGSGPSNYAYNGESVQTKEDLVIIEMAAKAINGEKFRNLMVGNWKDYYQSQSEADFAFIDIIAFYTQNREQITRIFRQSPLGARPKAKRNDYLDRMIGYSFDKMLPPIDIDGFKVALERFQNGSINRHSSILSNNVSAYNVANNNASNKELIYPFTEKFKLDPPPGLMGEIARFIYDASPRQIPEISIAAAIGLMAGITGKAYNVNAMGLNQYIIILALTGTGKESAASGIDKLMNAIKLQVPTAYNFIGPAEISSGQALVRYINQNPCFVSILGEFGIRMQSMSDPRANGPEKMLLRTFLDLYNKSGHHQSFRPTIFSDKEKNITTTLAPSFSVLAESTPETFYQVLNEDMVSAGLLPRFLIVEYKGKVPYLNENAKNVEPPLYLTDAFSSLVAQCEMINHAKRVIDVQSTPEADDMLRKFQYFATDKVNANDKDFVRQLWSRAHMKITRLSATIAVGCNMIEPVITVEHVKWSTNLVVNDIRILSSKFEQGEIGAHTSELKQLEHARSIIKEYLMLEDEKAEKYKVPKNVFEDRVITAQYLSRRLAGQTSYRNDKMGSTIALKRAIQALMDADVLREIPKSQMQSKYGNNQKAYVISNVKALGE